MSDTFRTVRNRLGAPAASMLDTKGPEIRLGILKTGKAMLQDGQTFTLTTKNITGDSTASLLYTPDAADERLSGDPVARPHVKINITLEPASDSTSFHNVMPCIQRTETPRHNYPQYIWTSRFSP